MIVVARYMSQADAAVAKARLEAAGVPAVVDGQHMVGMIGYGGGPGEVRLLVAPEHQDEAAAVLAEAAPQRHPEPDDRELDEGIARERRRWVRLVVILLLFLAVTLLIPFGAFLGGLIRSWFA